MNINFFRDQYKNPDHYPVDPIEKAEIANEIAKDEQAKKERQKEAPDLAEENAREKLHSSLAENYRLVIDSIRNAALKPEYADDAQEAAILENRKTVVLGTLKNILLDIENYVAQVQYSRNQRSISYNEVSEYQSEIGSADLTRRNYHNKLIGDLKQAIKWINVCFNEEFPRDLRIKEEGQLADRRNMSPEELGAALDKRNYLRFPLGLGVVIDKNKMPRESQGEREYIMHWAFEFYEDLTNLDNLLNKKEGENKK